MKIRMCLFFTLALLCYVRFVDSQSNILPGASVSSGLPENLKECYNDPSIVVPDTLLPMTLSTFLALIRKAENDPSPGQTDFRTMTAALLHRFRFDGIMFLPDVRDPGSGIIPYSANGNEFYLYRLIMDYVIPDPNIYFNNNTFTRIERCTLHRMLSLSVDPWMRGDNDVGCSNLQNDAFISKLNIRIPRDTSRLEDVEVFDTNKKSSGEEEMTKESYVYASNYNTNNQQPRSNCPIENGVIYTQSGSLNPGLVLAGIAAGSSSFATIDPSIMMQSKPKSGPGRTNIRQPQPMPGPRGRMPQDPYFNRNHNTFLQQNYPGQSNPGQNQGGYGPGNSGGYPGSYPGAGVPNRPGVSYPGSNNPNGGYPSGGRYPSSGGGYPSSGGGYPSSGGGYPSGGYPSNNMINKGWAATMAGILAEYALLQGPTGLLDKAIGIKGGWNDSISTKYYFLQDPTPDSLPETRIRGALDGLIMAKSIQKWSGQAGNSGNFKLSQLLTMYYSSIGVFDPTAVACNRNQRVSNVMSQSDAGDQTNNFAQVLINHLPSAATIDPRNIWTYTSQVANYANNIVSTMTNGACGQTSTSPSNGGKQPNQPTAYPNADLYVVMDLSYSYSDMKNILQYIMETTLVNPYRSNMTILTAKSCPTLNSTLINSAQNTLDAQVSFTNYSLCVGGFDFLYSLVQIKILMQNKLNYDTQIGLNPPYNNDIPRIVVFVPGQGVSIDANTAILANNKLLDYQVSIPDTKFLFLTPGPTDRWTQFSNSSYPDVFQLSRDQQGFRVGINKLVQRIAQIQRRVTNPTCGAYWNQGYTYNQVTMTENLLYNEIQYFRVHPNYFFLSTTGSIIVQPTQGTVQVCVSRTNPWPNRNSSQAADSICQSVSGGSSYTVASLNSSLCSSSYATACNPIFFSVQSTQQTQQSNPSTCNDPTCEFPNMINYRITHSGLTCYSSAISLLSSPLLVFAIIAAYFINT